MIKSESIKNIASALLVFHGEVGKIKKTASNPFFKSTYAPLDAILDAISEPLNKSGLIFSQHPDGSDLTTILVHVESGDYFQSAVNMNPVPDYFKEKNKEGEVVWRSESVYISPQAIGSAITYARRYALASILGLNIDDDDDGNAGSGNHTNKQNYKDDDNGLPWLNEKDENFKAVIEFMKKNENKQDALKKVREKYKVGKAVQEILINAK